MIMTIISMISLGTKKCMTGYITVKWLMDICVKSPKFSLFAWIHNAVKFHGNAGKKLRRHAKSKPHTDVILAITSTKIREALSSPSGIQEKTCNDVLES